MHSRRLRQTRIRGGRGEGGSERSAGLTISAMGVGAIALMILSCGDGTVEPAPPPAPVATTVVVSPASATLTALEETARLTAEVRDQNGQVMAGATVAWTSSHDLVATVDASGVVTAAANGAATITATAGSASGSATVTAARCSQRRYHPGPDLPQGPQRPRALVRRRSPNPQRVRSNGTARPVAGRRLGPRGPDRPWRTGRADHDGAQVHGRLLDLGDLRHRHAARPSGPAAGRRTRRQHQRGVSPGSVRWPHPVQHPACSAPFAFATRRRSR